MLRNKRNILYTTIEVIIICAIEFSVAIASVFLISLYLETLLIVKIKRAEQNSIPSHQLN